MPIQTRKELPPGFIICEYPDGTYQAQRENEPMQQSPRYTRRLKAVNWCWLQLGQEAARKD